MTMVRGYLAVVVGALVLAVAPFVASSYAVVFLIEALALIVFAYCWNLISGYTGYLTLGHIAYFGLGGYAAALAISNGLSWEFGLLLSALASGVLAFVLGPVILRLRSMAFAIATFGLSRILESFGYLLPWTNGGSGMYLTPAVSLNAIFWMLLALAAFTICATYKIDNSIFGLRLLAIRDDQDAARAMGINTLKYKRIALVLSAFPAGMAGALFVYYLAYIDPVNAFLPVRELMVAAGVLLGGIGTVTGPLLGMAIILIAYETLWASLPWLYQIFTGLVLVMTVTFMPRGILPALGQFNRAFGSRQSLRKEVDAEYIAMRKESQATVRDGASVGHRASELEANSLPRRTT